MNQHRVPMLGAALRRHVDPTRSSDPKVRELVSALAGLDVAPAPRPDFRAELRAQLVAVTPRLVSEGEAGLLPAASPERQEAPKHARGFRPARALIAAACVLTAFVLLLGGAVLLSRHALPGDALYGIKRASENTEYSLAGSSVDKGKLKLEFAAHRLGEVEDLLPGSGQPNAHTASLVSDTLLSADGDLRAAAQLLDTSAVRTGDARPLTSITSWTPAQIDTMRGVVAGLPAGALRSQASATLGLLTRLAQRADALRADLGCGCLTTSKPDLLGPLPCAGPCHGTSPRARRQGTTPATGTRAPGTRAPGTRAPGSRSGGNPSAATTAPTNGGRATGGGRHAVTTAPAGGHRSVPAVVVPTGPAATSPAGGALSTPAPALPTLPGVIGGLTGSKTGDVPSLPISVNSCGLSASVGPVKIGIGGC